MGKIVEMEKFINKKEVVTSGKPVFMYQVDLEKCGLNEFTQLITLSESLNLMLNEDQVNRVVKIIEQCTLDIDKIIKE